MTPRLLLEPQAEAEFLEAGRWYAERNAAIAAAFRTSVEHTLLAVERAPHQFRIALRDIRKALVRRFPYVFFYVVFSDVISGIAVGLCPGGHRTAFTARCADGTVAR